MQPRIPALFSAISACALALPLASAQVAVPAADRAGSAPAQPGDGLLGAVRFSSAHAIADAHNITAGAPAGSFRSTSVHHPNGSAAIVSVAIPQAGLDRFGVASDDNMRLRIGSQTILAYDADREFGLSTEVAAFVEPGLYPLDLLHWANDAGESGVELLWTLGTTEPLAVIPQSSLYSAVPSPGSIALLGGAVVALVRRRR